MNQRPDYVGFMEEYRALCHRYGLQLVARDQRVQVDNDTMVIRAPSLELTQIGQPPMAEDKEANNGDIDQIKLAR